MYVKIHNPQSMSHYGGNAGSAKQLIDYLEKENDDKVLHNERYFFDATRSDFSGYKASQLLDNNKKGLHSKDAKFFMLSINPSQLEQQHMIDNYGEDRMDEALQHYTRRVMDEYAKEFDRDICYKTDQQYFEADLRFKKAYKHNESIQNKLDKLEKEKPTDQKKLKEYRKQRKELIGQFQRDKGNQIIKPGAYIHDSRPLTGKDLMYFAKVETQRNYQYDDKHQQENYKHNYRVNEKVARQTKVVYQLEKQLNKDPMNRKLSSQLVRHKKILTKLDQEYKRDKGGQKILPGIKKGNHNYHVHVVVSRKDKSQTVSLSPLTNSKGSKNKLNGKEVKIGFNRDEFVNTAEKVFDQNFNYDRSEEEKYRNRYNRAKDPIAYVKAMQNPEVAAKQYVKRQVFKAIAEKHPDLAKELKKYDRIPTNGRALKEKAIQKGIEKAAQALNVEPTTRVIQFVVSQLRKMAGDLDKGMIRTR